MKNHKRSHIHKFFQFLLMGFLFCLILITNQAWADAKHVLPKKIIEQEGKKFLKNTLQWEQNRMEVDVVYEGKPTFIPQGKVTLQYKLPGNKKRVGRVPFMGFVKVDGIIKKRLRLYANVKVTYDIFRSVRSLKRGHVIQPGDVELVTLRSDKIMRNIISDDSELIGQRLIRNLEAGEPILNHMVRRVPLVKSGDRILIIVQKGKLRVTVPGVVKENGFKNDTVKVENIHSRKIVFGTVVDSRTIQINF